MGRSRPRKVTRPTLGLEPRQRAALLALADGATLEEAAANAKTTVDEVLYWLTDGKGARALAAVRAARREALQSRIEVAASEALDALRAVMTDGDAPHQARVAAAATLLRSVLALPPEKRPYMSSWEFEHVEVEEDIEATNSAAA